MGLKRRALLLGSAALVGGGLFAVHFRARSNASRAAALTTKNGEYSFAGWLKIAQDDAITLYVPHVDMGQGIYTALAQMCLEELDGDWKYVTVETAPADVAFANGPLIKGFIGGGLSLPTFLAGTQTALLDEAARFNTVQFTGGSTALRLTGQFGMRVVGAAARAALLETAAEVLKVSVSELRVEKSLVAHEASGRSLRFGELAQRASQRSLDSAPALKARSSFKLIGTSPPRLDVPSKVNGQVKYGIDVNFNHMRVATLRMAPVFGEFLQSVDETPALAVAGVHKVLRLPNAVVVVANGYWAASQGLNALRPVFAKATKSTNASLIDSSEALFAAQGQTLKGTLEKHFEKGRVENALKTSDAVRVEATYQVPFLHHASLEPISLTAHFYDQRLEVWGSIQDPLTARHYIAQAAGLSVDQVSFHATPIGGSFGRRFPSSAPQLQQIASIAVQLDSPVKLIWSREEDVTHGAYRPQLTATLQGAVKDGRALAWDVACVSDDKPGEAAAIPYDIDSVRVRSADCTHPFPTGAWRAVEFTQHAFYTESFMDELAHAAQVDPLEFRRRHLPSECRHRNVLEALAQKATWSQPLPKGRARGMAIVEGMGTVAAHVVEVSLDERQKLKVDRVVSVVDCGVVVHPDNAAHQVQGGILMGLSAALREEITMKNGAVEQRNFFDYQLLRMPDTPIIEVHFLETGAAIGGLGEPGLPPVAPALANAIFALTGRRIRRLPIGEQADMG
jgi:isoquinoline 1-oxidoreductase subunit beta